MPGNEIRIDRQAYFDDIFRSVRDDDRSKFRSLFLKLHDRDKHEVFHLLYPEKKKKLSKLLSPSEFADVFVWMDKEDQEDAIEYLAKEFLIEVLTFVPADDIAELVDYSDRFEPEYILDLLDTTRRDQVREMLAYEDETAGAIMIKEIYFGFC
ncbi:MAG: hypothetical protein GX326_07905 [Clostridiaceae bacterium]|nr:hypothetical protein [Clostridiaceae bacterium]